MNDRQGQQSKAPIYRVGQIDISGETSLSEAHRKALIALAQGSKRSKKVKFKAPSAYKDEKKGRK